MSINPSCFDFKWQGRVRYNNEDKVWGWFLYNEQGEDNNSNFGLRRKPEYCNVFWGRPTHKILMNRLRYSPWSQSQMVEKKLKSDYVKITVSELEKLWPNFYEKLTEQYVFSLMTTFAD